MIQSLGLFPQLKLNYIDDVQLTSVVDPGPEF